MSSNNVIFIKEGRHPLVERCRNVFVPNDTILQESNNSMLITAANASGKSIYLTQVALIVFMSHVGSFVPATDATIGMIYLTSGICPLIVACLKISQSASKGCMNDH